MAFANHNRSIADVLGDLIAHVLQVDAQEGAAGGVEGGMSTGDLLVARVAMKPLATLNRPVLKTVDVVSKEETVSFKERTDVTAVPAMGVVAETMVALTLAREALRKFGGDSLTEVVRVSGPDRLTWLHSLTTQFLEGLQPRLPTASFTEQTPLVIAPSATVTDVDLPNLASLTATLVARHPELSSRNPMPEMTHKAQLLPPPVDFSAIHAMAAQGEIPRQKRADNYADPEPDRAEDDGIGLGKSLK